MPKPPLRQNRGSGSRSAAGQQLLAENATIELTRSSSYEGPLPHPEILAGFDKIEAGTAKRIVDQFMDEGSHRHHVEMITIEANVTAQKATSELAAYKARAVVRSDTLGQVLATLVCFACILGAIWLAMLEHHVIAAILAALPTATLVKSFFAGNRDKA